MRKIYVYVMLCLLSVSEKQLAVGQGGGERQPTEYGEIRQRKSPACAEQTGETELTEVFT